MTDIIRSERIGRKLHRLDLLTCLHLRSQGDVIPPAQMRMLEFIERNENCTQAEVAEAMQVSPASVAQSLKRMEAAGFVSREQQQGNLRANKLAATESGILAARRCRCVFDGLEERMLAGLSAGEIGQLNLLLSRLIENLESADTGSMNNLELTMLIKSSEKQGLKGDKKQ